MEWGGKGSRVCQMTSRSSLRFMHHNCRRFKSHEILQFWHFKNRLKIPKISSSHFSFSSIQIFGIDISTCLIVLAYFRVDDGQSGRRLMDGWWSNPIQPAQSAPPPDSTGWWNCIDPVVLQNLSVFAQPEKASVFSLYILFFSENPPKRSYKCDNLE